MPQLVRGALATFVIIHYPGIGVFKLSASITMTTEKALRAVPETQGESLDKKPSKIHCDGFQNS